MCDSENEEMDIDAELRIEQEMEEESNTFEADMTCNRGKYCTHICYHI